MTRSVFLLSGLVVLAQACSNLGQTTAPIDPNGSGGTMGMDAGPDIQFKVDVAPPPPTDGPLFEASSMPTCVQATPKIKNVPPDVLIVLDRSQSMVRGSDDKDCTTASGNCANGNKWVQATAALATVLPKTQDMVNWGLFFFGDPHKSGTTCDVGTVADVAPSTANATAIANAIAGTKPESATPTTAAIKNAAAYLKGLKNDNPKFILLATDGLPTCGTATSVCTVDGTGGSGSGSGGAGGRTGAGGRAGTGGQQGGTGTGMFMCDDAAAAAAIKEAHDVDMIPTFVVGIATAGMGDATLNRMAVNGGFPRSGATQYYSVNSGEELQAALATITTQTKTCFFGIDPAIDDLHKIEKVTADGRALGSGDFMQVGNTGIQLIDQACKDFTEVTIKDVVVQVNCNG
jgi:hypothetical protein